MIRITGCVLVIFCRSAFCFAQLAVSASGGEATGAGGTGSYTVGQVTYMAITLGEGSVLQGVQQPFEIFVISNSEDRYEMAFDLSVCPNPAGNYIKLVSVNNTTGNLTYQLYDEHGKLLENKKIDDAETYIPLDTFVPSIYFLKVMNNDDEVKTFKIIKN